MTACAYPQRPTVLTFSAEGEPFAHPVQLPEDTLKVVLNDREDFPERSPANLHCSDTEIADRVPQLLCTTVPLSSTTGTNYLVIGVGYLRGAHSVPFWLLHQDAAGVSVLFKSRSDGITVEANSYRGYRIVEAASIAGAKIFTRRVRFTGNAYEMFSSSERRVP